MAKQHHERIDPTNDPEDDREIERRVKKRYRNDPRKQQGCANRKVKVGDRRRTKGL